MSKQRKTVSDDDFWNIINDLTVSSFALDELLADPEMVINYAIGYMEGYFRARLSDKQKNEIRENVEKLHKYFTENP